MISQIVQLLVETLFSLLIYLLLARFYMQVFRAPFRNPIGEFVVVLTNWAVRPVRRVLPGFAGIDLSSILLAWVAEALKLAILYSLRGISAAAQPGSVLGLVLAIGAVEVLRDSVYLLIGVVLIQVIISWVSPHNELQGVLNALTRPFYRIFRRFIPPIGSIDLSPLFVLLLAQVCLILIGGLERTVAGLF
jgi:YggT family protein